MSFKYILYLLLIAVTLGVGAYFLVLKSDPTEQWWYWGSLLTYLLLGMSVGRLYFKSVDASNSAFYRRVLSATGIRMFFCLLFLTIYLIVSELKATEFIAFFLISYLLFTIFEIYQIVAKLRPEKNSSLENTTS